MLWYHLVRRSSYCLGQWSSGKWRTIVPGTLGMRRSDRDLQGKAGENGQPGSCLRKSSLQETVGYAGGKLPAGVANDWVTCRSSKQHHGPHRLHLSVREKRERNPAQGAPQGQVETKRSPKDSSAPNFAIDFLPAIDEYLPCSSCEGAWHIVGRCSAGQCTV